MIILVEKSETGGEWTIYLNLSREITSVFYNGKDVSKRILTGGWMEKTLWQFFDDRYDIDEFVADYLYEMLNHREPEYYL
jgi:hypothetical protein